MWHRDEWGLKLPVYVAGREGYDCMSGPAQIFAEALQVERWNL
jgi:hypothetical protein